MTKHARQGAWSELRGGWSILAGATIGLAFGASALPFYTGGLFIGSFEHDFGWDRTSWSLVSTVCTLILALIAPLVGATVDRFGVRLPSAISLAALAGGFYLMSLLTKDFRQYVAIQVAMVVAASASTPIAFTRPINTVFSKARGLALGVAIGGIGLTAYVAPPVVGRIIAESGWRAAMQQLSLAVLLAAPVAITLLSRRSPGPRPAAGALSPRAKLPWRDPLLWRLAAAFFLVALAVGGFVQHFVPMLTDAGFELKTASDVQGMLGLAVLLGRLATGAGMDRIFAPWLAAGLVCTTAAGMILMAAGGPAFATPAALAVGFAMGAEVDLIAYMTARYFGMAAYSRLYGALYGAFLIGTAFSPLLIAFVRSRTGGYETPLWLSAALLLTAASLFLFARRFPEDSSLAAPPASARL